MVNRSQGTEAEHYTLLDSNCPRKGASRKRCIDLVVGSILLLHCLPLLFLIGLIILIRDGRPVFYVHRRVGRNGKPFGCIKFRTMVRNSQARLDQLLATNEAARLEWAANHKLRNDPRVLPWIGSLLRSSCLDELPQLWNVIRGDMSLVGPRPVVVDELSRYGLGEKLYKSIRPGLTGPWQIGERSNDDYAERVRKDLDYVRNWTLLGDFLIIAKTAKMVLTRSSNGAY